MSSKPKICVVVPTRNRPGVLKRLLESIAMQEDASCEVVIVDDGSDVPLSESMLASMTPEGMAGRVNLKRNEKSLGMCHAKNTGWRSSTAPLILFVDDDVELVGSDLFANLRRVASGDPSVGIVALAELAPDGGWGLNVAPDIGPQWVGRFYGFAAMIRRTCLDRCGGFWGPLEYYYDEFELSMRVLDGGFRIQFRPECRVFHHRDPRGRNQRRNARLLSRNSFLTIAARFPWWMIPPAVVAQSVRFSQRCWFHRPSDPFGPLAALIGATLRLPEVLADRRAVASKTLRRYKELVRHPELILESNK